MERETDDEIVLSQQHRGDLVIWFDGKKVLCDGTVLVINDTLKVSNSSILCSRSSYFDGYWTYNRGHLIFGDMIDGSDYSMNDTFQRPIIKTNMCLHRPHRFEALKKSGYVEKRLYLQAQWMCLPRVTCCVVMGGAEKTVYEFVMEMRYLLERYEWIYWHDRM